MAGKKFVIVESPTKAKTIKKFLPAGYIVEASMGHVRDLPQSASDIPAKLKEEEWTRLGVNVEKDFEPLYVTPKDKSKIITALKGKLKEADILYLATDEDREGESISWHLIELLKPKVPVKRMVFHEITKKAIQEALEHTRDIDLKLVQAQEARRILDRLYGYTLSPLIWKKIAYGLSAGRVQSVGLRLLVERERERRAFKQSVYWDISAQLKKDGTPFEARLLSLKGTRVATGKDFDGTTGKPSSDVVVLDEKGARDLATKLEKLPWKVTKVEEKTVSARPSPPFITSTLQQEGNRKLGLSARDTMRVAQALYEEGLITYMRTDSPNLSQQAIKAARDAIESMYGKDQLSPEPRQFASKSKGAQEAHEAIRPAGEEFVRPDQSGLSGRELALYDLIWKRTMASQMAEAKKLSMSVKIEAGDAIFNATGMRILFPGFLLVYAEGSDSPEKAMEDREIALPKLAEGDSVNVSALSPENHETKPPARFTEASIVQRLEKEGIGRPSTYASIISTIVDRGYARKAGNTLVPSFTGFAVYQILEKNFSDLVEYQFTSKMEESLDDIAEGKTEWIPYLRSFYSGPKGLQKQVELQEKKIKPEESRTVALGALDGIEVKIGRFGPYVVKASKKEGEEDIRASIPEDIAPADLTTEMLDDIIEASEKGPQAIGTHPDTGENIYCLLGRFGPYVQQGEITEAVPKPRRASVPKEIDYKNITLEQALKLLSLPRVLGQHPETKNDILSNRGRFGPYVQHGTDYRSIRPPDDVYTITLERALELLAQEKKGRRGSTILKELGAHPKAGKAIQLLEGKYGPYLKMGTKNYSILKETYPNPTEVTLEQAIAIVDSMPVKGKKKK